MKIYGIIEAKAPADRTMPQQLPVKQISDAVRQAIIGHLNKRMPEVDSWIVKLSLKEEQLKQIAPGVNSISVDGGAKPWTGPQTFEVCVPSAKGTLRVSVAAYVSLPPSVVVATQPLARGMIIRETDVRLQTGQPTEGSAEALTSLYEVIGKEAARAIGEGQILDDRFVRRQVMVRRGEIVTVNARTAGVQASAFRLAAATRARWVTW